MLREIRFQPDAAAESALRLLTANGVTEAAAIRAALLGAEETARASIAAEARAVSEDPADREEMAQALSEMESLRTPVRRPKLLGQRSDDDEFEFEFEKADIRSPQAFEDEDEA